MIIRALIFSMLCLTAFSQALHLEAPEFRPTRAHVYVDCLNLLTAATNGAAITDAALTASMIGGGDNARWLRYEGGSNYTSWFCATAPDTAFPTPIRCGPIIYTSTGTNALKYFLTNGATENIAFRVGAAYGSSTFSNLSISFMMQVALTNAISPRQLDLIQLDDVEPCIFQIQTDLPGLAVHAHGSTDSTNSFTIANSTTYYVTCKQQQPSSNIITIQDPATGAVLSTMTGATSGTLSSGNQARIQNNYLNVNNEITGWVSVWGINASWRNQ